MNPFAQFRQPTGVEEVVASRMIADQLTLLQCCSTGDGADAVIVVNNDPRKRLASPTVEISGSVLHYGTPTAGFCNMLRPEITKHSALDAYAQAGRGARKRVMDGKGGAESVGRGG